jgi:hypothetical protein
VYSNGREIRLRIGTGVGSNPTAGIMLRIPQRPGKYFYLHWPGEESLDLLSQYPFIDHKISHDCDNPLGVIKNTIWLLRQGQHARLVLPFYMRKYIPPAYRSHITEMPMLPKALPDKSDLAKHCQDAQGRVYPALWTLAKQHLLAGEGVIPAVGMAVHTLQPPLINSLQQFAPRGHLLRRWSLVRDFETVLRPGTKTPYFKTGRKLLDFFCDYGALAREGSGRVRWSPLFSSYFIFLDNLKRFG